MADSSIDIFPACERFCAQKCQLGSVVLSLHESLPSLQDAHAGIQVADTEDMLQSRYLLETCRQVAQNIVPDPEIL